MIYINIYTYTHIYTKKKKKGSSSGRWLRTIPQTHKKNIFIKTSTNIQQHMYGCIRDISTYTHPSTCTDMHTHNHTSDTQNCPCSCFGLLQGCAPLKTSEVFHPQKYIQRMYYVIVGCGGLCFYLLYIFFAL